MCHLVNQEDHNNLFGVSTFQYKLNEFSLPGAILSRYYHRIGAKNVIRKTHYPCATWLINKFLKKMIVQAYFNLTIIICLVSADFNMSSMNKEVHFHFLGLYWAEIIIGWGQKT